MTTCDASNAPSVSENPIIPYPPVVSESPANCKLKDDICIEIVNAVTTVANQDDSNNNDVYVPVLSEYSVNEAQQNDAKCKSIIDNIKSISGYILSDSGILYKRR